MTPVRLEPAALRSRVKHSTTEPLRSHNLTLKVSNICRGILWHWMLHAYCAKTMLIINNMCVECMFIVTLKQDVVLFFLMYFFIASINGFMAKLSDKTRLQISAN